MKIQGEGLVSLLPHKGASVREVNEKFVSDMYDIRMAIETMLVRNGVPFMKDSDYNRHVTIEEQYEKAAEEGDLLLCLKYNESGWRNGKQGIIVWQLYLQHVLLGHLPGEDAEHGFDCDDCIPDGEHEGTAEGQLGEPVRRMNGEILRRRVEGPGYYG